MKTSIITIGNNRKIGENEPLCAGYLGFQTVPKLKAFLDKIKYIEVWKQFVKT